MKTSLSFVLCLSSSLVFAATYGTLDDKSNFVAAPPTVVFDNGLHVTSHITEPQANALGYKLLIDQPPTCASNEYAVAVGYTEDTRIHRTYEKRTVTPPPRRWTPLSIKRSAAKLGYWDALKAFLVAANAYDDFCMAQYEAEDDADFIQLIAAARQKFGDSVVDAILNCAEVE